MYSSALLSSGNIVVLLFLHFIVVFIILTFYCFIAMLHTIIILYMVNALSKRSLYSYNTSSLQG
jgi:hypothetical protein